MNGDIAARCMQQLRMADGRLHEPIVAGRHPRSVSEAKAG